MRKPEKAQLLEVIREYLSSSKAAKLEAIIKTDHYVLYGGSLLRRLKWKEGSTYWSIAEMHASFTVDNYGKAIVVFNGYTERPSTKDNAHQRRCPQVTNKVDISIATQFVGKKDCLANNMNKQALIKLIASCMQHKGCHVIHAKGDADVDIGKAAITASSYSSTTLIRKDTELLGLLLYYYEELDSNDLYFWSDKDRITPYVYNIRILKQLLGHKFSYNLLFGHAFSGSNTTSQVFGVARRLFLLSYQR